MLPIPWRFALWTLGIIIDFATPLTARKFQLGLLPHASHLPERFGLFTMIVLGEAIIAVVKGVTKLTATQKATLKTLRALDYAKDN
ncbi:low temperature requirement protein A [aff. Roholtiella sp. LEGE 12411]|uniref:low temperature requirement protein A n=1 Tax=aff. Roholtiella sp. LEGE 12411 TaxID=1828822 RepID=UPI00351C23CF